MTASPLVGGIIAAGEGSRLRRDGWAMPKPLVPVGGTPLIGWVIRNFLAAGIQSLVVIVNEQEQDCVTFVRRAFPALDARFIVKTTASSLESFGEVTARVAEGPMLVSTVDAWCTERDFCRFVQAASARPAGATVLAVTPFVADENPLWIDLDASGRVARIGGADGARFVTAGMYLVSERARTTAPPRDLGRLRHFLAWLLTQGEPMYGEVIETVVDVDRAEDVVLAQAMALGEACSGGAA